MPPNRKGRCRGKGCAAVNAVSTANIALIGWAEAQHIHAKARGAVKASHHRHAAQGVIAVGDAVCAVFGGHADKIGILGVGLGRAGAA